MARPPKPPANAPCPCGRNAKFKRCCAVYHRGRPPKPETLMRARYSAYAARLPSYIVDTTHPDSPQFRSDAAAWKRELLEYCRSTNFLGLNVLAVELNEEAGRAHVTFTVTLERDGSPGGFTERSLFLLDGTAWKYYDADPQ